MGARGAATHAVRSVHAYDTAIVGGLRARAGLVSDSVCEPEAAILAWLIAPGGQWGGAVADADTFTTSTPPSPHAYDRRVNTIMIGFGMVFPDNNGIRRV